MIDHATDILQSHRSLAYTAFRFERSIAFSYRWSFYLLIFSDFTNRFYTKYRNMSQNRLISISWQIPTPSVGIVGYNIYLVEGSPPDQTKTFLAFNNGVNNTTYNYTGIENGVEYSPQYQFEVRSTDSINESPGLEIFYPNGTSLYTPTTITPTGLPMQIVRDMPYLTATEFINMPNGLRLTTSDPLYTSGMLTNILQAASEMVNRYAHRHFNTQTIDEVYHSIRIGQNEPKLVTVNLNEGPIQVVNSIYIQVLKFFINFSLDYLQVFPEQGFIQLVPFLGGNASGIPLPSAALLDGLLGKVWVNYTFGYDILPYSIKQATGLYATKLIGLEANPGSSSSIKFGRNFAMTFDDKIDPLVIQAQKLLDPYRITTWRRP